MKNVLKQCWNKKQQQLYRTKVIIIIAVIIKILMAK